MGDKLLLRLNIYGKPIANKYCEGKMKRTLKRESKVLEIAEIEGMASSSGSGIDSDEGSVTVGLQLAFGLCSSVAGRVRVGPVLGPRSGWILGGLEAPWEGGCRLGGRAYRPRPMDCRGLRCENPRLSGLGTLGNGAAVLAGCNASRRWPSSKLGSVHLWICDPDEMVVIHPS